MFAVKAHDNHNGLLAIKLIIQPVVCHCRSHMADLVLSLLLSAGTAAQVPAVLVFCFLLVELYRDVWQPCLICARHMCINCLGMSVVLAYVHLFAQGICVSVDFTYV